MFVTPTYDHLEPTLTPWRSYPRRPASQPRRTTEPHEITLRPCRRPLPRGAQRRPGPALPGSLVVAGGTLNTQRGRRGRPCAVARPGGPGPTVRTIALILGRRRAARSRSEER